MNYEIDDYGRYWAPFYDDIFDEVDHEVGLLASLAGEPARALELAVGTGRVAVPLSQAGVIVTGIEISDEMIAKLEEKPGGEAVRVIKGDFADVEVEEVFPLVYLPFNTLFALPTQERQVECFKNVAKALQPGGRFVLDTFVPDLKRFDEYNTRMGVSSINSAQAHAYELSVHHPLEQRVESHMVRRHDDGTTVVLPVTVRYAWPAEMDLMARLAGLTREERWGWYDKRPFTASSGQHVSVYRKT